MNLKKIEGYDNYMINELGEVFCNNERVEPYVHKSRNTYYLTPSPD